jgi:hypothetical protein
MLIILAEVGVKFGGILATPFPIIMGHELVGRVYQIMKKSTQAVKAYTKACELKPQHLEAHPSLHRRRRDGHLPIRSDGWDERGRERR